jgi:putative Mg2+ transporter-C (MgtC) family protein
VDIAWYDIWMNLLHLGAAYLLALPVAADQERNSRSAGLRTFPLVAVAACGYVLVGTSVLDTTEAESRVIEGVITGIGFIGGGAILKSKGYVTGTATAAAIWITGLIGVAAATDRFEIAVLLSLISFLTLRLAPLFKSQPESEKIESGDEEN